MSYCTGKCISAMGFVISYMVKEFYGSTVYEYTDFMVTENQQTEYKKFRNHGEDI
jgi:hypothetical protein